MRTTTPARPLSRLRSRGAVPAAALLAAGLLTGCSAAGSSTDPNRSSRTDTLVIAENEVPATFDPVQADNSTVDEVTLPAYDTLVTYSDGEVVGSLAEELTVADDGLSIAVTLREGVTFHDGTTLTAEDVAYTLDRTTQIGIGVASLLTAYQSTEVTDDTHLTITLSRAYAPFVPALSRLYILNSALVEENAGQDQGQTWLATHDAGSGPYELTSYTDGQEATFTRYDDYWQGFDGQAESVVFRYLGDASTQRSSLLNQDVDIAMDVAPTDWASFESDSDFVVDKATTNVALYAFFKMNGSATADPALREAVSYAYNYPEHLESILRGAGTAMTGPLASGITCADPATPQPTYDPARAQAVVDANGLAGTTVTMTYLQATAEMEQAATLLQSDLAAVGITLDLQAVTFPEYAERAASNDSTPDLGMIYSFPAYPDPDAVMFVNFDSQFVGGGQNWGGFSDPAYDALVREAQSTTDEAARCALYAQAQQQVASQYVTLNLSNPQYVTVYNSRLSGFTYASNHHQTVDVYKITVG